MNTFLSTLQAKAITPVQTETTVNPGPNELPPELCKKHEPDKLTINIQLVSSRNRIDIFFSAIPSEDIRTDLKRFGFKFNPDSKAWYNKDCENNRDILRAMFNADLEPYQGIALSTLVDSPPPGMNRDGQECTGCSDGLPKHTCETYTDVPPVQPLIELCEAPIEPELAKFRTQTNQLMEQLNLDAADLMLAAIDCLHRQTFRGNAPKN